jgi:predicted polyphosphate/ATP-dependent NAD kinase
MEDPQQADASADAAAVAVGRKRLGLVVNPIAGIGGKVGLKGSDGDVVQKHALELGGVSESSARAAEALTALMSAARGCEFDLLPWPRHMRERPALQPGLEPLVVGSLSSQTTTARDTKDAARELTRLGVDLLLFSGGDGTARDICDAVGLGPLVLGIPAGVKIHSAVFAKSPRNAGELAAVVLNSDSPPPLCEAEVMDIDEQAFREDRLAARLHGYLTIPSARRFLQSAKAGSGASDAVSAEIIAAGVVARMEPDCLYLIGPGTTTRAIMTKLGLQGTLLGVDAVLNGDLVGVDLREAQLREMIGGRATRIIVGVIGAQGYIFGRGNQQISAEIIEAVGKKNLIVVASKTKLFSLDGGSLLVDTGDPRVDAALAGYLPVVTGLDEVTVMRVSS